MFILGKRAKILSCSSHRSNLCLGPQFGWSYSTIELWGTGHQTEFTGQPLLNNDILVNFKGGSE